MIEMNVYEDGEKIGKVNVNIDNKEEVGKVLNEVFDCGEDVVFDIEKKGDEIYICISELEYLWNK